MTSCSLNPALTQIPLGGFLQPPAQIGRRLEAEPIASLVDATDEPVRIDFLPSRTIERQANAHRRQRAADAGDCLQRESWNGNRTERPLEHPSEFLEQRLDRDLIGVAKKESLAGGRSRRHPF